MGQRPRPCQRSQACAERWPAPWNALIVLRAPQPASSAGRDGHTHLQETGQPAQRQRSRHQYQLRYLAWSHPLLSFISIQRSMETPDEPQKNFAYEERCLWAYLVMINRKGGWVQKIFQQC